MVYIWLHLYVFPRTNVPKMMQTSTMLASFGLVKNPGLRVPPNRAQLALFDPRWAPKGAKGGLNWWRSTMINHDEHWKNYDYLSVTRMGMFTIENMWNLFWHLWSPAIMILWPLFPSFFLTIDGERHCLILFVGPPEAIYSSPQAAPTWSTSPASQMGKSMAISSYIIPFLHAIPRCGLLLPAIFRSHVFLLVPCFPHWEAFQSMVAAWVLLPCTVDICSSSNPAGRRWCGWKCLCHPHTSKALQQWRCSCYLWLWK